MKIKKEDYDVFLTKVMSLVGSISGIIFILFNWVLSRLVGYQISNLLFWLWALGMILTGYYYYRIWRYDNPELYGLWKENQKASTWWYQSLDPEERIEIYRRNK